jgi:hypothetical protein
MTKKPRPTRSSAYIFNEPWTVAKGARSVNIGEGGRLGKIRMEAQPPDDVLAHVMRAIAALPELRELLRRVAIHTPQAATARDLLARIEGSWPDGPQ